MNTETVLWTHMERGDARLVRRALCWCMGELLHVGPGGTTVDPERRGLGDFVTQLEGMTALLSCLNGVDAPGYIPHVPVDSADLLADVLRQYAHDCPALIDHYSEEGMDATVGFYEADQAAALALAERMDP